MDTDASGRIHFTAMLRHFEAAEIEFMRSLSLERTYLDQEMRGMQFPRVRVEALRAVAAVPFEHQALMQAEAAGAPELDGGRRQPQAGTGSGHR